MLDMIKAVLEFLSTFVVVIAIYAVIYVIRRLQGKNKPGDWKPRAVPFKPGEITSSISDSDDSDSSSSSSDSSGGGSFGGGGASGRW
jgi:uncharacterized membrane protein YgcG